MKKTIIAACSLLLSLFAAMGATTDIYLSSAGSDTHDGATPATAVATLGKAIGLIPTNGTDYVIRVSGFISTTSEYTLNRKISFTIEGDAETPSGFDGGNLAHALNFQGATGSATLRNLTFRNGSAAEGGGFRAINSGIIVFDHCVFTNNTTSGNSGTLHLYNVTDAKIFRCTFQNNRAKLGGGVYQNSGGKIAMDSCQIEYNDLSSIGGSSGGGIYLGNPNGFTLTNSIIRNNKVAAFGGGIALAASTGAMTDRTIVITNTLIADNTANQGGGIYINNAVAGGSTDFSLINTTVYKNLSVSYGGALFVVGNTCVGSQVKIVNATIVENNTQGNGGHGAGINFRDASPASLTRHIYNSILEDNVALNNNNPQYSDITSSYPVVDGTDFFLRHSYVAATQANLGAGAYTDQAAYGNVIRYAPAHHSGLATPSRTYIDEQNAIPLLTDAEALTRGNAQYLKDLNIDTDQLGNRRLFANGTCAAGAVEVPDDYIVPNPKGYRYQHFIIYGQSLSVGKISYQAMPETPLPNNYMIGSQIWIANGNTGLDQLNPLVSNFNHNMSNTGENPLTGAVNHIRLASAHTLTDNDKFIATSTGDGGRTIAQLSKGHELKLYDHYLTALQSARSIARKEGSTITCPAIFWMQGESDYILLPSASKSAYKAALLRLKNDMQADAAARYDQQGEKPLFFTYQTNGSWTRTKGSLGVGTAQVEAANENEDIICAGPVYPVTSMPDGHLDANGYRWYGEMFGKAYYQTKVLGQKFRPLQPVDVAIDGREVLIRFYVPVPPLVLDTKTVQPIDHYGFEVYLNGFETSNKQSITHVELVGDDAVKLTCAAALTGEVHVVYAGEKSGPGQQSGHGNLRDSDTATGYYHYLNPEGKADGLHYDYPHNPIDDPRHADWTYVPASGEPKDAAGRARWDQPYPLYNFSVAFCKTIDTDASAHRYRHFIIYGQSLSTGAQGYPPLSTEPVRGNYMLGSQIWINYEHPAGDLNEINPLYSNLPYSDILKDKNYNVMGENPLTAAVNHIQQKTQGTAAASRILATSCGTGGAALEQLEKGTGLYINQFLKAITTAKTVLGDDVELSCPAIFWLQGEANSVPNENGYATDKATYKAKMLRLKNDMQADIAARYGQTDKPVFITYQMSGLFMRNFADLPISTAQVEASNENNDVVCAGPVYPLTIATSGAHPNANGYRWFGEMLGKVYYRTQVLHEDFKPLQPLGFYRTEHADELKIKFLVPHPPLVLDVDLIPKQAGFGFEVMRNGLKLSIVGVEIDGDCVILSLSTALAPADEVEITYAGIDLQAGNLRDSDPYQSLTTYEDLDRNDGGVFYYPRKDNATLRPRQEPKNASGAVIYGQPYPLYNFCVAFYRKLTIGDLTTALAAPSPADRTLPEIYVENNTLIVKGVQPDRVELFDLSGRRLRTFSANAAGGRFALDNLPRGVYVGRVKAQGAMYAAKIVR